MKFRRGTKIKSKHHNIDGFDKLFNGIEKMPEVLSINPGVIEKCSFGGVPQIKVSCCFENSIKCTIKSSGAAQEVYIVCSDVSAVFEAIKIMK